MIGCTRIKGGQSGSVCTRKSSVAVRPQVSTACKKWHEVRTSVWVGSPCTNEDGLHRRKTRAIEPQSIAHIVGTIGRRVTTGCHRLDGGDSRGRCTGEDG